MTRFARVQRHDSPAAVPRRRRTAQQQAVLDMLGGSDHFRSAQQLHLELNRQRPLRVGLATVYRILQTFTDQRTVETQRAEDGETLYRLRTDNGHHHYLLCRRCGHAVGFTPTTGPRRKKL